MGKGEFFEDSFAWSAKAAATVLKVRCESGWCRGYDFDIKLLVTSREVHKPEITKSKEEKKLSLNACKFPSEVHWVPWRWSDPSLTLVHPTEWLRHCFKSGNTNKCLIAFEAAFVQIGGLTKLPRSLGSGPSSSAL